MLKLLTKRFFSTPTDIVPKVLHVNKPRSDQLFTDAWITKLSSRSIVSVRGRDSTSILQNTMTNDMRLFSDENRAALYTGFLTNKGKVMFDAIVAKPKLASQTADDMEYWVDLHENDVEAFIKHIKKYAMRKNIQFDDISHVIKAFSIQTLTGVQAEPEGMFF